MSINQLDSGSGGFDIRTFKGTTRDGCRPDARIHVDGVEIPYCNDGVQTTVRKDGSADITRESTIQLPITWGEHTVANVVNGLSGKTPKRQRCSIELLDPFSDEYVPIHHGYISAAGGHNDRGTARIRVSDFSNLLSEIPASRRFEADASVATVIKYVKDKLIEGQEVFDDIEIEFRNIDGEDEVTIMMPPEVSRNLRSLEDDGSDTQLDGTSIDAMTDAFHDELVNTVAEAIGVFDFDRFDTPSSFSADRDRLSDVLDWVDRHLGVRHYFQPRPANELPRLVIDGSPTQATFHDTDHVTPSTDDSRPLKVLQNNALYQLNPVHKLLARGRAPSLTERARNIANDDVEGGEFPVVTVEYEPLAEQTDDEYPPNEIEVDAASQRETENVAKTELKDRLDGAQGGEIHVSPSPHVRPYARLDLVPVCGSTALTDLPSLSYEAEEVIHYAPTAHGDAEPATPRTVIRAGLHIDESRITTISNDTRSA